MKIGRFEFKITPKPIKSTDKGIIVLESLQQLNSKRIKALEEAISSMTIILNELTKNRN